MLSEKIKALRKQAGMSQEQLAERLSVSRQAVTKWETDGGIPDVENLRSIAALFGISLDELLENNPREQTRKKFLFESVTEYDIDRVKSYDITIAGARQTVLTGYEGEKVRVCLASDHIPDIQSMFKVKIDDVRQRIDIDVRRFEGMTEAKAKESLYLSIQLPSRYVKAVELSGNTGTLELNGLAAEGLEYTGTTEQLLYDAEIGHMEINCNRDMKIRCRKLSGRFDVNQISASSRITVPEKTPFVTVVKGIGNRVFYEADGKPAGDFSLQGGDAAQCPNVIELNGLKSELIISAEAYEESRS